MRNDRFLIGILIGLGILVAAAFALVLLKGGPNYLPETEPQGVAHNYLLALQRGDFPRAWEYISQEILNPPVDHDQLEQDIQSCHYTFTNLSRDTTLYTEFQEEVEDGVFVRVHETIYERQGLFGDGIRKSSFILTLHQEGEEWKVIRGDRYWCLCWSQPTRCK